jgi:hypothetical protein
VVLVKYLESQAELRDSNENRMRFCAYALDKLRFLYQKADGDDKQVRLVFDYHLRADILHRTSVAYIKARLWCKHSQRTSARSTVLTRSLGSTFQVKRYWRPVGLLRCPAPLYVYLLFTFPVLLTYWLGPTSTDTYSHRDAYN